MLNLTWRLPNMTNAITASINFVPGSITEMPDLPGSDLLWLKAKRKSGIDRFNDLGLPTTRIEGWKYTNLKPLEGSRFQPTSVDDGMAVIDKVPSLLNSSDSHRLVFVNGRIRNSFEIKADLPEGVQLESLTDVLAENPEWIENHLGNLTDDSLALVQLNMAMLDTGFLLKVAPGVVVDRPIEIISIGGVANQPVAYFPRNLVLMGKEHILL